MVAEHAAKKRAPPAGAESVPGGAADAPEDLKAMVPVSGGDEGGATPAVCDADARSGGTVQALRAMVEEAKAELASARREMQTLISEKKEQKNKEQSE